MSDPENRFDGPGKPAEPVEIQADKSERGSFVQRIGLTGILGGTAALITAVATLVTAFNKPAGSASEASHTPTPAAVSTAGPSSADSGFLIGDYWSGIPEGTDQPLVFHIFVDGKSVLGTMRNPCQSDIVVPIDSGTWDGSRLTLHVSKVSSKEPVMLDVNRAGDRLEGSVTQIPYDGHITLRRGEIPCPAKK